MIPSIEDIKKESSNILEGVPGSVFDGKTRIAIYGAGFLGRWSITWLQSKGANLVSCFDGNPELAGKEESGLTISPPDDLYQVKPDFVFITARHAVAQVSKILKEKEISYCSLDAFFVSSNLRDLLHIHESILHDEQSKETLRSVLMALLTGNRIFCQHVYTPDQYFCLPMFFGTSNEIFVDAGAYTGDTVERFIWANDGHFSKIFAFEPGLRQFSALQFRSKRLHSEWALDESAIILERAGLAATQSFMCGDTQSGQLQSYSLEEGGNGTVKTYRLDEYLAGEQVTFIKVDVEGMEMGLLHGAVDTIRKWKPKIAISVYHYPSDILDVVNYLHDLVPEYIFSLRHHSARLNETILYCWDEKYI